MTAGVAPLPQCRICQAKHESVGAQDLCGGGTIAPKPPSRNTLRVQGRRVCGLPLLRAGGSSVMVRTVGAAVGAALVILFLASMASRLTWVSLYR